MSTRPWQHVLDPLVGYLLTLQEVLKGSDIESVNFGPAETSLAVSEVVEIAMTCWGASATVKIDGSADSVYEASKLELSSLLAKELLNWDPVWSQRSAVQATTEWWKGLLLEGKDPFELCQKDIGYALEHLKS